MATARALLESEPAANILILEKESALGKHQTGRNSGVIHAGIYYRPGSLKARLCREGERVTKDFCTEHGIPFTTPGKLVVATDAAELERLKMLEKNAGVNGIPVERIDGAELRRMEPNVSGVAALLVRSSGIVDYLQIAEVMAAQLREAGVKFVFGENAIRMDEQSDRIEVITDQGNWSCRKAIACAGLQSDRLIRNSGIEVDFRIIPFKGEYYRLGTEKENIVTRMIYPVPDPELPFLGIHLTPLAGGGMSVGPNAVLSAAREGYGKLSFNGRDLLSTLSYPGFWRLIGAQLGAGIDEMKNSLFKGIYLKKCQKYCPSLELEDLLPHRAGIRAQAVTREGKTLDDFHFIQTERILYVGNAPSPAATSAIPIGRIIAARLNGAKQ